MPNIYPRLSEKTYAAAEDLNVYVFEVPISFNKHQIKELVESTYEVSVIRVRSLRQKGKPANSIRLKARSRPTAGSRSDLKKAYVTLKAGDKLPIFAEQAPNQGGPDGR